MGKPPNREPSILFTGDWVLIGDAQRSREEAHLQFRKFHFCSFLVNKFWHLFSHCGCPCFQHQKCEPITNDSYWHINRGCLYCHLVWPFYPLKPFRSFKHPFLLWEGCAIETTQDCQDVSQNDLNQ